MRKKTVCIIGHFGFGKELLNGQTIKAKIIADEIEKKFGSDEVIKLDSHGGKKRILPLFVKIAQAMKHSKNVIMLPAKNGVRFFAPVLLFWKKIFGGKLHYIVIGGWLPQYVECKPHLKRLLIKFDVVYVETSTMQRSLEMQGFQNIQVMPNCKNLDILKEDTLFFHTDAPYKLCTFSRVSKEKGIEYAIEAVQSVNNELGHTVLELDIFGAVDNDYSERFQALQADFPAYIKYAGTIAYSDSVNVLKNYYVLLFPTYYEGEGFAGTLIDAFAAGLPVIASDWKYNAEIVRNGQTGFIVETHNQKQLIAQLKYIVANRVQINEMKSKCLSEARKYIPETVIKTVLQNLA